MTHVSSPASISKDRFIAQTHIWIRRHKGQVFLLAALCWGLMALVATMMRTDASSMAFLPDDEPKLRQMAEALDIAPASRLLFINISTNQPENQPALAQAADAVVNNLPPDLAERVGTFAMPDPGSLLTLLPFLIDATTLELLIDSTRTENIDAAILGARNSLGSLLSSPLLQWLQADPLAFRDIILSRLPAFEESALPDPLLGYPISQDGNNLLLMLRPKHSLHDVRAAMRLMDNLQESLLEHLQPGMQSLVVGGYRHSAANARTIEQDVTKIVTLSLAGFALLYLLLVRSKGALWIFLVPCCAICVALGGMGLLFPSVSGLALGFGASVLGIADDYVIHMHFALRSGQRHTKVLKTMALPLFQGYLVNAAGFSVLLLSGIPAIRQLAGFALLALSIGFVLAVTIAPICPWFAEPLTHSSQKAAEPRKPVVWRTSLAVLILISMCCIFFKIIQIDVSPRTMGADMAQMQEDAAHLNSIWGSQETEMLVVQAQDIESAMDLANRVVILLRKQEPENQISTLTDIWPAPEQRMENLVRWTTFLGEYGNRLKLRVHEAANKYGFTEDAFAPFEQTLSLPNAEFSAKFLSAVGLGELVATFLPEPAQRANDVNDIKILIYARQKPDISLLPPELLLHVTALSPSGLETALLAQFAKEKRLLPLTWLVCFSLLFIFFRDIKRALLASLPPLCSITCILAWMVFTGASLTLAGMAALPLVLGLAADHGIMVTHDLAHGVNLGLERAVLVASLTAILSMGLLAFAHHPALNAMGEVIFLGLLVEIPASLLLLPRLCRPSNISSTGTA